MKISELPLTTSVDGSEILPIVQGGTTKKVSITDALAGAGGGGTNPTPNYLPYNNAGTFADSFLVQDGDILKTFNNGDGGVYIDYANNQYNYGIIGSSAMYISPNQIIMSNSGPIGYFHIFDSGNLIYIGTQTDIGLKVDISNSKFTFGNFSENTGIIIDLTQLLSFIPAADSNTRLFLGSLGGNEVLSLQDADGQEYGLKINHSNRLYRIGQFDTIAGNGYSLVINDADSLVNFTKGNNNRFGFGIDGNITFLGDVDGYNNHTFLTINDDSQIIGTYGAGNDWGLGLNFNNGKFVLGFYNGGCSFGLNAELETLIADPSLTVGGSHSTSGQHLKIKIGGTDYVIELKNA